MSNTTLGYKLPYIEGNWLNTLHPDNIKDLKSLVEELKAQNNAQAKVIKDLVVEIENMYTILARAINTKADA